MYVCVIFKILKYILSMACLCLIALAPLTLPTSPICSCSRLWYHLHQREILDTIHCQSLYLLLTCCATPLVGFPVVSAAPLATSTPALRPARSPWALPVLRAPPRGVGSARPRRGSAAHRRCAPTARRLPPRAPAKLPRRHP